MRLLTLSVVVVGLVLGCGIALDAQQRSEQMRSKAAATRPGPPSAPAGESPFRNTMTHRPRPISPSLGIPLRFPVFPLVWGWGTMPFYFDSLSAPLALQDGPTGGVQLDVQPWRASVFVDGVYAGRVDDFSGYYKHLDVVSGPHQIVIVEPGYQPLVIDADVVPGRTRTYKGTLTR
jgi:hypothetical protein